jgi:hypothetical protein
MNKHNTLYQTSQKTSKLALRKSFRRFRQRFFLYSAISPSISCEFSICPMIEHFERKMTTRICSTIKINLGLFKEIQASILLHKVLLRGGSTQKHNTFANPLGTSSSHPNLAHPVYLQQTCLLFNS